MTYFYSITLIFFTLFSSFSSAGLVSEESCVTAYSGDIPGLKYASLHDTEIHPDSKKNTLSPSARIGLDLVLRSESGRMIFWKWLTEDLKILNEVRADGGYDPLYARLYLLLHYFDRPIDLNGAHSNPRIDAYIRHEASKVGASFRGRFLGIAPLPKWNRLRSGSRVERWSLKRVARGNEGDLIEQIIARFETVLASTSTSAESRETTFKVVNLIFTLSIDLLRNEPNDTLFSNKVESLLAQVKAFTSHVGRSSFTTAIEVASDAGGEVTFPGVGLILKYGLGALLKKLNPDRQSRELMVEAGADPHGMVPVEPKNTLLLLMTRDLLGLKDQESDVIESALALGESGFQDPVKMREFGDLTKRVFPEAAAVDNLAIENYFAANSNSPQDEHPIFGSTTSIGRRLMRRNFLAVGAFTGSEALWPKLSQEELSLFREMIRKSLDIYNEDEAPEEGMSLFLAYLSLEGLARGYTPTLRLLDKEFNIDARSGQNYEQRLGAYLKLFAPASNSFFRQSDRDRHFLVQCFTVVYHLYAGEILQMETSLNTLTSLVKSLEGSKKEKEDVLNWVGLRAALSHAALNFGQPDEIASTVMDSTHFRRWRLLIPLLTELAVIDKGDTVGPQRVALKASIMRAKENYRPLPGLEDDVSVQDYLEQFGQELVVAKIVAQFRFDGKRHEEFNLIQEIVEADREGLFRRFLVENPIQLLKVSQFLSEVSQKVNSENQVAVIETTLRIYKIVLMRLSEISEENSAFRVSLNDAEEENGEVIVSFNSLIDQLNFEVKPGSHSIESLLVSLRNGKTKIGLKFHEISCSWDLYLQRGDY